VILEVLAPGVLATVQDGGRPGFERFGVPPSGACDPRGLAVANALLGNALDASAIEITAGGLEIRVREPTVIGLGGADLGAVVLEEGRALAPESSHVAWAGQTIRFAGHAAGAVAGIRAYLAVPGGLDLPEVMGSAATCLVAGFGGVDGRRLRPGDVLRARRPSDPTLAGRTWPSGPGLSVDGPGSVEGTLVVRVVAGPHADHFPPAALAQFTRTQWSVRPDSDRMGIRLAGAAIPRRTHAADLVSVPMTWGAVQVPSDGVPIALLADHQTVGGYPVLAVVIRADLPIVGQLAPNDRVGFEVVTLDVARAAWRAERARFGAELEGLARGEHWTDHWRWAGA
jgi:antagonist of KipI